MMRQWRIAAAGPRRDAHEVPRGTLETGPRVADNDPMAVVIEDGSVANAIQAEGGIGVNVSRG